MVTQAKTPDSGCVATYVGLIRDNSRGKAVLSVEYSDADGKAIDRLNDIAMEVQRKYPVNKVVIYHRIGKLNVGDINLVVAIAAAHRGEGIALSLMPLTFLKIGCPPPKKRPIWTARYLKDIN
ncbi:MAG: hypothetical protein A2Z15_06615 [Chloroflexi bacterium RBG_16_50_11]|nr:MAG: hypothetical protein A2Z15_06615 [Chloroflexi bacterium RBG_16_50_11]